MLCIARVGVSEEPCRQVGTASNGAEASDNRIATPVAAQGLPTAPSPRVEVPEWWRQRHASMNARLKQGNVDLIFIGDSITQRWEQDGKDVWRRYYGHRNAVNLGIDGDRTQQVLWRLDHGNIDGISPRLAVLLIGTNNILEATPETIAEAVKAIIAKLRTKLPQTKLLVLGILPRAATHGDSLEDVRRAIVETNRRISALADGEMTVFCDIGPKFQERDGTLRKEAFTSDMVHLAPAGYRIWAEAIEPIVGQLLKEST